MKPSIWFCESQLSSVPNESAKLVMTDKWRCRRTWHFESTCVKMKKKLAFFIVKLTIWKQHIDSIVNRIDNNFEIPISMKWSLIWGGSFMRVRVKSWSQKERQLTNRIFLSHIFTHLYFPRDNYSFLVYFTWHIWSWSDIYISKSIFGYNIHAKLL